MVPKDPFLHPQDFCTALAAYVQSTSSTTPSHSNHTSISIPSPFHTPHVPFHAPHLPASLAHNNHSLSTPALAAALALNPPLPPAPGQPAMAYLTLSLISNIAAAFAKTRAGGGDGRKMHRVLLNKLDDIATDLRGGELANAGAGMASDEELDGMGWGGSRKSSLALGGIRMSGSEKGDGTGTGGQLLSGIGSLASGLGLSSASATGAGALFEPTSDLGALVRVLVASEKGTYRERERDKEKEKEGVVEGRGTAGSLKGLWSGRVRLVVRMREREKERERKEQEQGRDKEKGSVWSDGDTDGGKTTEDETDVFGGMPWSGRMQKRIEAWAKYVRLPVQSDIILMHWTVD